MVFYRCVFAVTWSNIVLNLVYHKEYYVQLSTPHSVLCSVLCSLPVANMKSTWCVLLVLLRAWNHFHLLSWYNLYLWIDCDHIKSTPSSRRPSAVVPSKFHCDTSKSHQNQIPNIEKNESRRPSWSSKFHCDGRKLLLLSPDLHMPGISPVISCVTDLFTWSALFWS